MFDEGLRRLKDRGLGILEGRWMGKVSPNQVTTAAFLVGLLIPIFLYLGYNRTAFIFWLLNRTLDGFDGLIARKRNMKTDFGGYYDILSDFVIYALIPLSLAFRARSEAIYCAVMILLSVFYVNAASWMYLSGLLEKRKSECLHETPRGAGAESNPLTSLRMPRGIVEGAETIVFYSLFILFPGLSFYLMIGMAMMTFAGIPQRLMFAWKILKEKGLE